MPFDFRMICMALGFTAVAIRGDKLPEKEIAQRALQLAALIEEFCRTPPSIGEGQS